jgi:hypothetical protein
MGERESPDAREELDRTRQGLSGGRNRAVGIEDA